MKRLEDYKEEIHKCSKCGLCQAQCPVYKVTGNDCAVSRGQFIMLQGIIKGDLKMSKTLNRYLDLCLKCGACSKFCPSGIDVVDVIIAAKSEYFRAHFVEKLKSFIQSKFVFGLFPNIIKLFSKNKKSKKFDKKVVYFGGCGSKLKGIYSVVTLLNKLGVEIITPHFACCGIPLFMRGDLEGFNKSIKNFIKLVKKSGVNEVVTTCASCEKALKDYIRYAESEDDKEFLSGVKIVNVYEYLRDYHFRLKTPCKVTFHKPCNINNYEDIKHILENTENLEYIEMKDFNKCCGLNGLTKFGEYKIMSKIFKKKRQNIIETDADYVLTSCLGCEAALKAYAFKAYKVKDLVEFLAHTV